MAMPGSLVDVVLTYSDHKDHLVTVTVNGNEVWSDNWMNGMIEPLEKIFKAMPNVQYRYEER